MMPHLNFQSLSIKLNPGLQFLCFNDSEIALDYQCAQENPTHLLILVNGYQRTRLDFRALRKKLEKKVPYLATVAFDNRFCGETKVHSQTPVTLETMALDAQAIAQVFMNKLGLKSVSFLGISMGGMILQTLASLPSVNFIENLFLVSTTAGGVGRTWPESVKNPAALKYENKNTSLESTQKNMSRYFADKFLKNSGFLFEMMCKNIFAQSQRSLQENSKNDLEQFNLAVHYDGVALLSKICAQKTIIISGDEDKIIPLQNATYLNQHIQNSHLIVYPQVGHLILIEEPEVFLQDVTSFFSLEA